MRGRAEVLAHLAAQRTTARAALRPLFVRHLDGAVAVTVHQVVHDVDGDVLSDTTVLHLLTLVGGLVLRLDVGEPPP